MVDEAGRLAGEFGLGDGGAAAAAGDQLLHAFDYLFVAFEEVVGEQRFGVFNGEEAAGFGGEGVGGEGELLPEGLIGGAGAGGDDLFDGAVSFVELGEEFIAVDGIGALVKVGEDGVEGALFAVDFVDEAVGDDLFAGEAFGGGADLLGVIDADVAGDEQEGDDEREAGDEDAENAFVGNVLKHPRVTFGSRTWSFQGYRKSEPEQSRKGGIPGTEKRHPPASYAQLPFFRDRGKMECAAS